MRALRVDDQGHVHLTDSCREPEVGAGEVRVRVTRVLLTHADAVAAGLGARPASILPFVGTLGHLAVGVVKRTEWAGAPEIGRKGGNSPLMQRVAITPSVACGHCPMCRGGLSPHCRSRTVMGLRGRDGACAEWVSVPSASLLAIPDSIGDDQAVFAQPVARALHAAHMIRSENKAYVTVIGDSLIALLTAQALARVNKSVRLLSTMSDRARLCERWGIRHRPLGEAGLRQDQDAVVDCTGTLAGLERSLHMVRPRGTVLIQSPLAMFPHPIGRPSAGTETSRMGAGESGAGLAGGCLELAACNEVHVVGCREGPMPDAFGLMLEGGTGGGVDVSGLSPSRSRLEQAVAVLEALREPETLGYLIDPEAR